MAAVITLTGNGFSAGTQNATATQAIKITGDLKGGKISIYASNEDDNYGLVMPEEYFPVHQSRSQVFRMQFSAGTYFKVALNGATGTASVRVVAW